MKDIPRPWSYWTYEENYNDLHYIEVFQVLPKEYITDEVKNKRNYEPGDVPIRTVWCGNIDYLGDFSGGIGVTDLTGAEFWENNEQKAPIAKEDIPFLVLHHVT